MVGVRGELKTTDIYLLKVLEAGNLTLRYVLGHAPSETSWRESFPRLPASGGPRLSLACGCIPPTLCLHIHMAVCVSPLLIRVSSYCIPLLIRVSSYCIRVPLNALISTCSTETPLPCQVVFRGTGGYGGTQWPLSAPFL